MQDSTSNTAKRIPVRRRHKELNIALIILGLLVLLLIVAVVMNMSVIRLLLHPENIEINNLQDSLPDLRRLEETGKIRNLDISMEPDGLTTVIRFHSPDESIAVSAFFREEAFFRLTGDIVSEKSSVSTIGGAKNLAADLLGPFLSNDEIQAILLTFSSSIIAQAGQEYMDMAMTLGGRYDVSIIGNPYKTVNFTVSVK